MGVQAFVVSDGALVTSYRSHYKALRCLLWFAAVFNLSFDYPNFGEGVPPTINDGTVG